MPSSTLIRVLLCGLSVAAVVACSCQVTAHVRGSTRGHVTFEIDGGRGISHLRVLAREVSGAWQPAWEVSGEDEVQEIVYGTLPAGFREQATANVLPPNGIFEVTVGTRQGAVGPPCSGALLFTFSPAGVVKECADIAACQAIAGLKADAAR